jgi:hypothetical protein
LGMENKDVPGRAASTSAVAFPQVAA